MRKIIRFGPRTLLSLAAAFCALFQQALANAQDAAPSEDIVLRYEAARGCTDRGEFVRQVQELTQRARIVDVPQPGLREFSVRIERSPRRIVGKLEILQAGESTTREVDGKTCDEVVSALALATALALDPAFGAPSEPAPPPVPPTPPPPKPKPKPAKPKPKPAAPPKAQPPEPNPAPEPASAYRGLVEAGVWGKRTAAPELIGASLALGFEGSRLLTLTIGGVYAPAQTSQSARFNLWAVRVEAVVPFWEHPAFNLELSSGAEVGEMSAEGRDIPRARTERRLWVALDAGAGLRWLPVSGFFVRPRLGFEFPLVRQRFSIVGSDGLSKIIHEVPAFGLRPSLSMGVTFQ